MQAAVPAWTGCTQAHASPSCVEVTLQRLTNMTTLCFARGRVCCLVLIVTVAHALLVAHTGERELLRGGDGHRRGSAGGGVSAAGGAATGRAEQGHGCGRRRRRRLLQAAAGACALVLAAEAWEGRSEALTLRCQRVCVNRSSCGALRAVPDASDVPPIVCVRSMCENGAERLVA